MNFNFEGTLLNKGKNAISIVGLNKFLEAYGEQARSLGYVEEANMIEDLVEALSKTMNKEKSA